MINLFLRCLQQAKSKVIKMPCIVKTNHEINKLLDMYSEWHRQKNHWIREEVSAQIYFANVIFFLFH